jgi:hypothetical protein
MNTSKQKRVCGPLDGRRFATSSAVMGLFGYGSRAAFHQFVKASGVPCLRLNSRRFMFDEAQLQDWIAKRSTGRTP